MRQFVGLITVALLLAGCATAPRHLLIELTNTTDVPRRGEAVEIPLQTLIDRLQPDATEFFVVTDADGQEIPAQLTYNDNLLFAADVDARSRATYRIEAGTPKPFETRTSAVAYGDDSYVVWENDRIAFRAAARLEGDTTDRAAGYDVWVKNTPRLLAEAWIDRCTEEGLEADSLPRVLRTDELLAMDCYRAAHTPGCGGTLLATPGGALLYPEGWDDYELLDNGPLRVTLRLACRYRLPGSEADGAVPRETRIVSLDAGSALCRARLTFEAPAADSLKWFTALPLRSSDAPFTAETALGLLACADPTDSIAPDHGTLFTGCVFPAGVERTGLKPLPAPEAARRHAASYIYALTPRQGDTFSYLFGAAWSGEKQPFANTAQWVEYLTREAYKLQHPLSVTLR